MYEAVLSWIEAHPEAFALLVSIALPVLLSGLSFLDGAAAKRWPVAVAIARALLPDLKRAAAIAASGALESRKLPVPPEIAQLRVERVEKAIVESSKRPPPMPPFVPPTLLCLALALTGCADLTYARSVRDASHDAAETAAPLVDRWCVAQQAADLAEVRALPEGSKERERRAEQAQALQRDRRCEQVVEAYDALRTASITLDATVAAAETGQCMAARSASCDVGGAAAKAATATAALATYVQHLQEASR